MAKKKIVSTNETIKDGSPIALTNVVKKLGLHAKTGDNILFTRISDVAFMATIGKPATTEFKKNDVLFTTEIPLDFIVSELCKYNKEKKVPNRLETTNSLIALSKIGLKTFYEIVEAHYHVSERMVRRYISRGLMPAPERYGKKAYYNESESDVFSFLNVIDTFKKRYNLSLNDIEMIVNNYRDQIVKLDFILADIETKFNKPRLPSPYYIQIRKRFIKIIESKTVNLEKINIKTIVKEIKGKQS